LYRRKIGKRKKGGKVSNPEIKTGSGFPSKIESMFRDQETPIWIPTE